MGRWADDAGRPVMDLGLEGKVAWVLGASSGLGRASAAALAREGAQVALSARTESQLRAAATSISSETGHDCLAVPLDVTDAAATERAAAEISSELGPVDVLVFNAGGPPAGSFETLDEDTLRSAFELVAASAWRTAQAVAPAMRERGTGVLIFITSSSTKEVIPGLLLSNMLRPAVVGMAKTLSKELGPHGIRVLCVAPGRHATERRRHLDELAAAAAGRPVQDVVRDQLRRVPLGRDGSPEELGDVVAFLAGARASYVTGITLLVDGGASTGVLS